MIAWKRRSLLLGILLSPVIVLGAGKGWCWFNMVSPRNTTNLHLLIDAFSQSNDVKALGRTYLNRKANAALAALRRLEDQKEIRSALESGCPVEIRSAFTRACREDFRAGRVHSDDGWILSQSELDVAVLCAAG